MALYVSPEKKKEGEDAFIQAVGQTNRRQFLKTALAASAGLPIAAAMYFGFKKLDGKPVKTALIGTGDEGGVLTGAHNPDYLEIVAVCDIRPSNLKRIFEGDKANLVARPGLNRIYGKKTAARIKKFDGDYQKMLEDPWVKDNVEAVIIALPLHLHAPAAIACMEAGKHVLCEKLMARTVADCKKMIRTARATDRILTIGHQRHYSLLYQHALDVIKSGQLGTIKHIRALWHRNNSWPLLKDGQPVKDPITGGDMIRDGWRKAVPKEDRDKLEKAIKDYGYDTLEQLVRWRLFRKYGGGLMAELGSHQLDACSIFLGKVHPLAVSGVGGKFFYDDERECDDNVFCTFEFPGPDYFAKDKFKHGKIDEVVVTYSSINTNGFEPYGECIMGSRATMTVEKEQTAALYPENDPNKKKPVDKGMSVSVTAGAAGAPVVDSSSTTGDVDPAAIRAVGQAALGPRPVSRGYREEMEDFAFCIRMHAQAKGEEEKKAWREGPPGKPGEPRGPRCHGMVAMADAIIALTSNIAMETHQRIEFQDKWFKLSDDPSKDAEEVPEVILKQLNRKA
jgi:predicted dehydrogenase